MKIRLLDYRGREHFCEVPNNTKQIVINIVSGDMVMTSPVHFDTSNSRIINCLDGTRVLNKKDFHILNEITDSCDLF